ncbi:GNAT family N-acetyltransferase [Desulfovibrio sp.]
MTPAFRDDVFPQDVEAIRALVRSTGFFTEEECVMAGDLAAERLEKGLDASGYHFLFLGPAGAFQAYACFGPVCCAQGSFDLYWIAVSQDARGQGLGSRVLAEAEARMKALGCRKVWVETSTKPLYQPTRAFYAARTYRLEATLDDYYAPGDGKAVFSKTL